MGARRCTQRPAASLGVEAGFSKVNELIGAPNFRISMDWTDSNEYTGGVTYNANTMFPQHTLNAAFADMDGSGTVDVVLVCNGGLKQVWTNDGRGNFALKSNAIDNTGNAHIAGDSNRGALVM